MPKLNDKHKEYIVQAHAYNRRIPEIQEEFELIYKFPVSYHQVLNYHPYKLSGNTKLADRWKERFDKAHEQYLKSMDDIPLAHKPVRVRKLHEMYDKIEGKMSYALEKNNFVIYDKLSERLQSISRQIAEEIGDVYTNKHHITGDNNGTDLRGAQVQINQYFGIENADNDKDGGRGQIEG